MEKKDYVQNYYDAYNEMKQAALKVIKELGKEIDLVEIAKAIITENEGELEKDEMLECLDSWMAENAYACAVTLKHGDILGCSVYKVRYNKDKDMVEVYLVDDYGELEDWYDEWFVTYDRDAVYATILEYADEIKKD